ncbi:MAG: hypothetical protein R3F00_17005 [Dokdonella sp.]
MMTEGRSYLPIPLDGFELCHPREQSDFEIVNVLIDGTPRAANWSPLDVIIIDDEFGRKLKRSDAPWMTDGCLVFGERVLERLGGLLRDQGELLPLACRQRNLWAFNPNAVLPCLDEAKSEVLRLDTGRIFHVARYSMKEHVVAGHLLYKCDVFRVSPTFVGQEFVDAWRAANLEGLEFDEVWRSF